MIQWKKNYKLNSIDSRQVKTVEELMKTCLGHDDNFSREYFLRGFLSKNNICTLGALEKGRTVGLITAWKSEFHPYCTYFSMITERSLGNEVETL